MSNLIQSFYDRIRDSVNVSDYVRTKVNLTRKGMEYTGLCPFHSEKTPSFTVNDKKKFYHCFGCSAHGDVIRFESETSGLSYKDSAYKIAEKYSIEVPKFSKEEEYEQIKTDKIHTILSITSEYYASKLDSKIITTLKNRGITEDIIKKYKLGYSGKAGELINHFNNKKYTLNELCEAGILSKKSDGRYIEFFTNRIMIPIKSSFGKIIGFGARSINDEMPKYINSSENFVFKKGESLFGEDIAYSSAYKAGNIILVEGYFDVISLHQNGFLNTVASLGTAVTKNQIDKMWRMADEIIICLDGDEAGIRASKRLLNIVLENITSGKNISFVLLPKGYDPDDFINKFGKNAFSNLLEERKNFSSYLFSYLTKTLNHTTPEERAEFQKSLLEHANIIKDKIFRNNVVAYFKNETWKLFNNKITQQKTNITPLKNQEAKYKIDEAILGFLLFKLDKFNNEKFHEYASKIENFSSIIEFISENAFNDSGEYNNDFHEIIKNTSFYKEFEILCENSKHSIPNNVNVSSEEILDYLFSKRYLITLTEEFKKLASSSDINHDRTKFYLKEIELTRSNIQKFNTKIDLSER